MAVPRLASVIASAVLGLVFSAQAADAPLLVRIGHSAPLTGPLALLGKDHENGVRLAIDELNQRKLVIGGKPVRFLLWSEDDMADPATAAAVAQKFVDAKVNGVIGRLNAGTTIPAARIYSRAGLAQISPSATTVKYTAQGYNTAFRLMANDARQGRVLGEYAVTKLGARTIAVIDDRTPYGEGLADEFEKAAKAAGGRIIRREYITDQTTDFTAIINSIKAVKPDLLFYGGADAQAAPIVRQLRNQGLDTLFLGGDGIHSAAFLKLATDAAEGTVASLPGVPLARMPGGKAFERKFTAKYGAVQRYAPYCYDAMMVLADAMQRADSVEPAKYLPMLPSTDYAGVTAKVRFDERGDLRSGAVTLYTVKDGQWRPLETVW